METKFIKKLLLSLSFIGMWFVFAAIPSDYVANYDIETDRSSISNIFIQIQANNKIWVETPVSTFWTLHQSFVNIFPKFPQDYNFQVVYQQCIQLSNTLSKVYNTNTFASFMDNCYKPLSQILTNINTNFTVKANAIARPTSWPAPLTVTFDARSSVDPSNETIPSDNFFRYYRDVNGQDKAIWIWPVINHTFGEAWNYIVHLTVRSSNKTAKWVFDWKKTLSIDVKPKAAVISVFANGKKLKTNEKMKFWTQEWAKGMLLDGSATMAIWGRQVLSHSREITSANWFRFSKPWDGLPSAIKVILPHEWEYKVLLKTTDNEWNNISEQYSVIISDPIAVIKKYPETWTTSNSFKFDAGASYSIVSRLRSFTWEIFDWQWNKMQTFQWKSINYQFKQPWSYIVKLTVEDDLWQTNIETIQVYVDSSTPIAQFNIRPSETRKFASKFIFDANPSFDVDAENWFDSLNYSRSFSNPKSTNVISTKEWDKVIEVSFDSIWEHKIKLTVQDKFGKLGEIEKTINIASTLRPEIFVVPQATTWWNPINLVAQSNENVLSYQWNFGDWEVISTQTNKVSHIYKKVGQYKITLTVHDEDGNENTITDKVFIWSKNLPLVIYKVIWENQDILRQNEECLEIINGNEIVNPAYKVERYQTFTIDPKESVNAKWDKTNLAFHFQAKNSEIYRKDTFKTKFDEIGCQFVDLTVEDLSLWINQKNRVWFKVYNALPRLKNLVLFFPQYGNEMWIWFNENQARDITNAGFDPLIVKVQALDAVDPDWFISYFKRYYYDKNDPTRPIETKITPGNIPYAYFSLPKIPGEFMFGVTLYDSDDWKNSSEQIIWNWPIVFFPPDTKRPDIPLVTLKADKTTVDVWDEVVFDVISKIISDRSDFVQERTIYYDFNWDLERDLITKNDRVSYIYTEPNDNWYIPRAAVTYRWYKWMWEWGSIVVKKWLKPRMLTETAGKFVLFRDISLWEIEKSTICLNLLDCKKKEDGYLMNTKKTPVFSFEYPEYKKYVASIDIEDKYANQANARQIIDLTWVRNSDGEVVNYTWNFKLLSIPQSSENEDGDLEILVGNSLDNSVAFYLLFDDQDGKKECYVDLDISDWEDKDFYCNHVFFQKFDPRYESIIWKIYYQEGEEMLSKNLKVSFIDFSIKLDEKTQVIYDRITKLINNSTNEWFKALLINLQKWIIDPVETQANLVAVQNYLLDESVSSLTDEERKEIQRIINELSDSTSISAMWGTEYDIAKKEILQILPSNLRIEIERLFVEFENVEWDDEQQLSQNDKRKRVLNEMLSLISEKITKNVENQKPDEIIKEDMDSIIMPNICKIMNYYEIASEKCASDDVKIIDDTAVKVERWARSGLKILLIVLLSSVWLLVAVIAFFAIKAKMNKQEYSEDENA